MSASSDSIRVVGERDLLELARIPRGTWGGWLRNGYFEASKTGLYGEAEVISLTLFGNLAGSLPTRKAAIVWKECAGVVVETCIAGSSGEHPIVLVVDLQALEGQVTTDARELLDAIHINTPSLRGFLAIPVGAAAREASRGFWKRAKPASELAGDGRRRTAKAKGATKEAL